MSAPVQLFVHVNYLNKRWRAVALLALALLTGIAARAGEEIYRGTLPQPDGVAAWQVELVLRDNGSAVLRTAKTSIDRTIINAVWKKTEDGGITVQFLNRSARPRGLPLVMKREGEYFVAVSWEPATWGEAGPPRLRKVER